jgi:type II secretion system protein H
MYESRRKSSGFTLLELIVVLVILAMVSALVAPSMRAFTVGQTTDNAAQQIVVLARYARTQSITEGNSYRLNFDPQGGAYWLSSSAAGVYKDLPGEYGEHLTLPVGATMRTDLTRQTDGTYVTFQSTGRADVAHIWISDKQGKTVEVACTSATELYRILPLEEMTR